MSKDESPLDVLSRAATMVEKSDNSGPEPMDQSVDNTNTTCPSSNNRLGCERSPSFKERHPKFRKSSTPDYLLAADQARMVKLHRQSSLSEPRRSPSPQNLSQQPQAQPLDDSNQEINVDDSNEEINVDVVEEEEEEGPIDMSIRKRSTTPPPPPYQYTPLSLLPPPSYSAVRPPPPPYPTCPPSPPHPISSTTKGPETRRPPPSYESSTVKISYPSPPFVKKDLKFNNPSNEEVSTTTPKKAEKRRNRKARGVSPPERDDRPVREITIITDSSADPLLDEHFRRSLGHNYETLFLKKESSPSSPTSTSPSSTSASSSAKVSPEVTSKKRDPVKALKDDMDMEGYTVEDHFAKALGDTWVRLQAKAEEKKVKEEPVSSSSDNNNRRIPNSCL